MRSFLDGIYNQRIIHYTEKVYLAFLIYGGP